MRVLILSLVALGFGLSALTLWTGPNPHSLWGLNSAIAAFQDAAASRDWERIKPFVCPHSDEKCDIARPFFLDPAYVREHWGPDARPVADLVAGAQVRHIGQRGDPVTGDQIIVIFVSPEIEIDEVAPAFWADRWMIDFAACWFHFGGGGWSTGPCFHETGGPFHPEYG